MARVMYFESNRSSDDGMLAVGTVVMNRLESGRYPKTVCGVVGQDKQFAEGALTKDVNKRHSSWARAERAADAVLAGERHDGVGDAKFFHTAGYKFPYRNMKYVTLAGGNIFYEKRYPAPGAPAWPSASMFAAAQSKPANAPKATMFARADLGGTSGSDNTDERYTPAAAPMRAERGPVTIEQPKPVMLARADAAPERDEEDEVAPAAVPIRAERKAPSVAARPQPVVLARTAWRPSFDLDEEDDEAPALAKTVRPKASVAAAKPQPVVVAATRPQPVVIASVQPAPVSRWKPSDIAATLRNAKPAPAAVAVHPVSRPAVVAALHQASPAKADKGRPAVATASAAQPPTRPKPIVVAMLADKARPTPPPRSIAALIAASSDGRRAVR